MSSIARVFAKNGGRKLKNRLNKRLLLPVHVLRIIVISLLTHSLTYPLIYLSTHLLLSQLVTNSLSYPLT